MVITTITEPHYLNNFKPCSALLKCHAIEPDTGQWSDALARPEHDQAKAFSITGVQDIVLVDWAVVFTATRKPCQEICIRCHRWLKRSTSELALAAWGN